MFITTIRLSNPAPNKSAMLLFPNGHKINITIHTNPECEECTKVQERASKYYNVRNQSSTDCEDHHFAIYKHAPVNVPLLLHDEKLYVEADNLSELRTWGHYTKRPPSLLRHQQQLFKRVTSMLQEKRS